MMLHIIFLEKCRNRWSKFITRISDSAALKHIKIILIGERPSKAEEVETYQKVEKVAICYFYM